MAIATGIIPSLRSSDMLSRFKLKLAGKKDLVQRNKSHLNNHVGKISWADLPHDLLLTIFTHLQNVDDYSFRDVYQCLSVCHSWRFVAKQVWQNNILPTTPWLLCHSGINEVSFMTNLFKCHETNANTEDPIFLCSLPNVGPRLRSTDTPYPPPPCLDYNRKTPYATHDGWLLLGAEFGDGLYLFNPITGAFLKLPLISSSTVPIISDDYVKFVSSGTAPTDLNCIICVKFTSDREFIRRSKAEVGNESILAFCKPASSLSWYTLNDNVEDMIFYRGKFYSIDNNGALFLYNDDVINGNTMASLTWKEIKIAEAVSSKDDGEWYRFFYLIESVSGEMLMIKRIFGTNTPITTSFRVFKLNTQLNQYRDCYCWEEISNLPENESLFLGWNECTSLSINNYAHNTYKPNCIYFFDQLFTGQLLDGPLAAYRALLIYEGCIDYVEGGPLTAHGMYDLTNHTNHYRFIGREDARGFHCQLFTPYKIANV